MYIKSAVFLLCLAYASANYNTEWCEAAGNVYTIYPGTGCTAFDQRKGYGPVPTFSLVRSHNCPEGTIFDVNTCVCNQPGRTVCNDHYYTDMYGDYNKGGHSYAPAWCDRADNVYTIVPGTQCMAFDQRVGSGPINDYPRSTHYCPYGTYFDTLRCTCDWVKTGYECMEYYYL